MSTNNVYEVSRISGISYHGALNRYRLFLDGYLSFSQLFDVVNVESYPKAELIRAIVRIVGMDESSARRRIKAFENNQIEEHALYLSRRDFFRYRESKNVQKVGGCH